MSNNATQDDSTINTTNINIDMLCNKDEDDLIHKFNNNDNNADNNANYA